MRLLHISIPYLRDDPGVPCGAAFFSLFLIPFDSHYPRKIALLIFYYFVSTLILFSKDMPDQYTMIFKNTTLFRHGWSMLLLLSLSFWGCDGSKKSTSTPEAELVQRICLCEDDLFAFNLEVADEMLKADEKRQQEIIAEGARRMNLMENCVLQAKADLSLMDRELDRALILSKLKLTCPDKPGSFHERVMIEMGNLL